MKKKYYYLSFLFVLGFTTLFAQNTVTISGKVKNAKQDTIKVIWYGNFDVTYRYQAIVNKKGVHGHTAHSITTLQTTTRRERCGCPWAGASFGRKKRDRRSAWR